MRRRRGFSWLDTVKTGLLIVALAALAAIVGYVAVGGAGLLLGGLVLAFSAASLQVSSAFVMRLQGAVPLRPQQAPALFEMVARLAGRACLPVPALYFIDHPVANAMAVGDRRDGALAVTRGTLELLSPAELEAVLAHELAHLKHGDTQVMKLTNLIARATVQVLQLATWLAVLTALFTGGSLARASLLSLLALGVPIMIGFLVTAVSRTRELAADATSAELTGRPMALASALHKLERYHQGWFRRLVPTPEVPDWLRSHPGTEERVARLAALSPPPKGPSFAAR